MEADEVSTSVSPAVGAWAAVVGAAVAPVEVGAAEVKSPVPAAAVVGLAVAVPGVGALVG